MSREKHPANSPADSRAPEAAPLPIRVTDRRPRFDQGPAEAGEPVPARSPYPTILVELEARASAAEEKLSQARDLLRRREAEAEDFRSRLRREMEKRARVQVESVLRDLLEVVDSLDRGMAAAAADTDLPALRDGLGRVRDQFLTVLARQGVEPMRLLGSLYDPHLAEAVATCPAEEDQQDHQVVEEIRRGYRFAGEVLRPAQVRVAVRPAPVSSPAGEETSPPTGP